MVGRKASILRVTQYPLLYCRLRRNNSQRCECIGAVGQGSNYNLEKVRATEHRMTTRQHDNLEAVCATVQPPVGLNHEQEVSCLAQQPGDRSHSQNIPRDTIQGKVFICSLINDQP